MTLRYTLIADGSSDKALMNIIKWVLDTNFPKLPCSGTFADFRYIPKKPKSGNILERVNCAQEFFPYDILLYHRDSELITVGILEERTQEIHNSLTTELIENLVCIIPICMMESWLLFDELAIKKASGNRNYAQSLDLPNINRIEKYRTPKDKLHDLLKESSGLKNRRLKTFNPHQAVHLVAENITDYKPLRRLQSFAKFEDALVKTVNQFMRQQNIVAF